MKLNELLVKSEKSSKFYNIKTIPCLVENQKKTVIDMLTIQEGTGVSGSFCNWIMEAGRNFNLPLAECREISNYFQRESLDAKHSSSGNYKNSDWSKLSELKNTVNNKYSYDRIENLVYRALDLVEDVEEEISTNEKYSFLD